MVSQVRLRTIDNYQGEQARIVILSLVRNSGASPDEDDETSVPGIRTANYNIGFLKVCLPCSQIAGWY
jgi:AAA domain